MGHERVEIDATLTPGEPGRGYQTQFEKEIAAMVEKERNFPYAKDGKLQFIDGETIRLSSPPFSGLKTHDEYVQLKEEEKRRTELSRFSLEKSEIDDMIRFEKNRKDGTAIPENIQRIYSKIELRAFEIEKQQEEANREDKQSLLRRVNRQADDFLALQKMKNNYVYGLSNPALRQAQEGVVDLHLPPVDMAAVLKDVDREFIKQHPMMKTVLEEMRVEKRSQEGGVGEKERVEEQKGRDRKRARIHISNQAFLDVNTPLKEEEVKQEKSLVIPDDVIDANRLAEEELEKLPQMRNYQRGPECAVVYVKNLPRGIGKEEMMALFDRFEKHAANAKPVVYTLLTGRMKGQAFVEFSSKEIAAKAIDHLHGFVYKGKPLILQFKR